MEGIEILAVGQIGVGSSFNWLMAIIAGLLLGATAFVLGLYYDDGVIATGIGLLVGILVGALVGFANGTPTHYVPTYKVVISDEVSMNEFTERYEILEQEGKIYTVKERKEE